VAFRKLREKQIYAGHLFSLVEADFEAPGGTAFTRAVVRHPGAVGVVPVHADGTVSLVRQYRAAAGADVLEIPAGVRDEEGEEPLATAKRELAGEVGLEAADWRHLASYWVAVGFSDERFWCFLAEGLTECEKAPASHEEEHMTVERVSLAEVPVLVESGAIEDAKTIIGLLLTREILAVT
jgi:ADP-ribose pyrophosphatase